jgi:hypothetical protein
MQTLLSLVLPTACLSGLRIQAIQNFLLLYVTRFYAMLPHSVHAAIQRNLFAHAPCQLPFEVVVARLDRLVLAGVSYVGTVCSFRDVH